MPTKSPMYQILNQGQMQLPTKPQGCQISVFGYNFKTPPKIGTPQKRTHRKNVNFYCVDMEIGLMYLK